MKIEDVTPTLDPWSLNMWKPVDLSWTTVLPCISLIYLAPLKPMTAHHITILTNMAPQVQNLPMIYADLRLGFLSKLSTIT